jgi:anhydro-N-acetylmuramic acid kinase
MSGTSADGIDAALAALRGRFPNIKVRLLAFRTYPYPREVKDEIFNVFRSVREVNSKSALAVLPRLDVLLGELFAEAALSLLDEAGFPPSRVEAISSHGQTLYHQPLPEEIAGRTVRCTFQAGDGSVIAQRSGIKTVSDFRRADMAVGGEGAPLVPMADYILFRHPEKNRALLNIGGVANLTFLPAGCSPDKIVAFDSGPGNMLIDGLVSWRSGGRESFDDGGRLALKGRVHENLLKKWLEHPYFKRLPPKSTGREEFGDCFLRRVLDESGSISTEDLAATLSALTADSISLSLKDYFPSADELLAAGGGVHNPSIMGRLTRSLSGIRVLNSSESGVPEDAREAIAFAILGYLTLRGRAAGIPSATGAERPVVLGKISPV